MATMAGLSNRHSKLFVSIFIVLLSTAIFYVPLRIFRAKGKETNFLFIAIPSSPDNIEQRQSLRETWLQLVPDKSYSYKFVLGKNMCDIHPNDRKSEYSCESLNISLPKDTTGSSLLYSNSLKLHDKQVEFGLGFMFLVHHSVIIQSLGIQQSALTSTSGKMTRVVLNFMPHDNVSLNLTKIASVTFHSDSAFKNANIERYVYKKLLNPVHLPKGFEGMLMVETVDEFNQEGSYPMLSHWEHGNLLTISNVITTNSFGSSENPYCILPSFGFTIKDIAELESTINQTSQRKVEWNKHIAKLHQQLDVETAQHKDMLFLDMVDVYRNLPTKMLLFLKWLFENYDVKYVLKTDDDSFVDILKIKEELEKPGDWDWWSCFRIGWPVKRSGKWREAFDYKEEIYPPFPTGAGYVMSERTLLWLESRLDTLSVRYQGEDVAMGIWLQGMAPSRHVGDACYWACVEQCHRRSCNVMQLTVPAVYRVWRKYRDCGNRLCDCPTD